MDVITLDAVVVCSHEQGVIRNRASQEWVTVEEIPVLVATDPQDRAIVGCPNANPLAGQKPCLKTLPVREGYSAFVRVDERDLCLDAVTGLTDGAPQGAFTYHVRTPGQRLVTCDG
jgi:hypothetical protein